MHSPNLVDVADSHPWSDDDEEFGVQMFLPYEPRDFPNIQRFVTKRRDQQTWLTVINDLTIQS